MSNLTERLLVLRDELDLDELSGANTLTEAANRIAELEAERDRIQEAARAEASAAQTQYERANRAEAERDRLRGTLRLLADTPNKLPTWARHLARAALDEGEG